MQKKLLAGILAIVIIVIAAVIGAWQMNLFSAQPSPTPSPSTTPSSEPTSSPSPNARAIKIGLVAGLSTSIGQDMDRAARMAVDEINAAGGIFVEEWNTKVAIELVPVDTVDDSPAKAVTPVSRAVLEDKVDLLIGGYSSAGTMADQVVAIENKVPYIITGASSQLVTRRGPQGNFGGLPADSSDRITDAEGMSYMFHYCTTTYHYSKTVVDFFSEVMRPMLLNGSYGFSADRQFRLGILYRNDAFGKGVVAASEYWIANQNLPIEVVIKRPVETSDVSFQTHLSAVKDAKPDAVFVVDNPDRTPEIIKEGEVNVKLNTVYIAVENNEDPLFYQLLGQNGDKQLLESKFSPYAGAYLPAIATYVASYKEKYDNQTPGMMGADTYDAFYIAKDAIERAGTVEKSAVRDAIESTDMDQLLIMTQTGKIEFSVGEDYHEIAPLTFIEQLVWNSTVGECRPVIVWPESVPGVGQLAQADFVLPDGYQPGSP